MGFKFVPPEFHLLTSAVKEDASVTSIGVFTKAGQVLVYVWSADEEQLRLASDEESARYSAAVQRLELDDNLAPYDADQSPVWRDLSSHATSDVVDRIQPVGSFVHSETELGTLSSEVQLPAAGGDAAQTEDTAVAGAGGTPAPTATRGSYLYFSSIPGCGPGSRPVDRTAYAQDTSFALIAVAGQLLKHRHAQDSSSLARQLIGELQLAYVLFVFGQAYSGLEAWKRLLDVLMRCEDVQLGRPEGVAQAVERAVQASASTPAGQQAIRPHVTAAVGMLDSSFFETALSAVSAQLHALPQDTFSTELTSDSFLAPAFAALVRTLRGASPDDPGAAG